MLSENNSFPRQGLSKIRMARTVENALPLPTSGSSKKQQQSTTEQEASAWTNTFCVAQACQDCWRLRVQAGTPTASGTQAPTGTHFPLLAQ
jgi:hypothetical protein